MRARHAGTVWEWLEILFQNGIRSHARWSLVKTVTSIILFKCANYWHIIVINTREHIKLLYLVRCTMNDAQVIYMYKTNSELAFGDHSTRRTRWKIVRWLSTRRGIVFKDAAGETKEGITFFRTAYSSLKLDMVFHDHKIPETFRARTARNFTK